MKKRTRENTLKKRLITYFLIIIFSMVLLNVYSSSQYKTFYGSVYVRLQKLMDIYTITREVDSLYLEVDNYTQTGLQKYVDSYELYTSKLQVDVSQSIENSAEDEYFDLTDLRNMILTFDEEAKKIIDDYNNKVEPVYINESLVDLNRLKTNINDQAKNILLRQLDPILTYYKNYGRDISARERLTYFLFAVITLGCIIVAIRFTSQISNPIHQLVLRLQKFAKGQASTEKFEIRTNNEIDTLIDSYNTMTAKITDQIREIQDNANLEKELKEEQIKNLEISNLLKQSELQFLQSQINPHFLYNTMNTIAALATIENAARTKKMIECMSDMLKYNLKKANESVTLQEEIKVIEDYIYIQEARFGKRIEYRIDYDQDTMSYTVPSMILQPFVENAIKHGLEPKEEKGLLEITIKNQDFIIEIMVRDNGVGMQPDKLRNIMNSYRDVLHGIHTGIGISNVLRRLEIRYGEQVVDIKSTPEVGTTVRITLRKEQLSA